MILRDSEESQPISIILFESYRNWVIDGMMKDSLHAVDLKANWFFLPDSKRSIFLRSLIKFRIRRERQSTQVFANHKTYFDYYSGRKTKLGKIRIFLTQVLENDFSLETASPDSLKRVERFVVQNLEVEKYLIRIGVEKEKIVINPGGVNRDYFYPLRDSKLIGDYVLISGSFKYRKNPELIAEVVTSCPDINFIIHGNNLEEFPEDLGSNVTFVNFNFKNQANLMRSARLHLVLSKVEGGPMSVLEALASGTPCVTTNVGFCREVINASSGVVLNENSTIHDIRDAINFAWKLKDSVYNRDLLEGKYTWLRFGEDLFM